MSSSIDTIKALGPMIAALQVDDSTRAEWMDSLTKEVNNLEAKYADLEEAAKSDANAKRNMNAVAKGIPAFSKGVMGAIIGFQKNDPLAGSAGVIDAVSSIITTVASMSSAAGPPGAIIGAILGVVSMILKFFSNQKPAKSLSQQLDEVIRNYDSEKYVQHLKTVQNSIEEFVENTSSDLYRTHTYQEAILVHSKEVPKGKVRIMDAALWLQEPNNQELKLWSVVLAAQCFAYIAYSQSLVTTMSLIKLEEEREKFRKVFIPAFSHTQLNFLRDVLQVVRNRGTVWYSSRSGYLYNRTVVVSTKNSDWQLCGAAKGGEDARMQSLTVTTRSNQAMAPIHPNWAQFSSESTFVDRNQYFVGQSLEKNKNTPFSSPGFDRYKFQGRFGQAPFSEKYGLALKLEMHPQKSLSKVHSVYALPGRTSGQVWVYTAHGDRVMFWKHGDKNHTSSEEQQLLQRGSFAMREGYLMGRVSAVFPKHPPKETNASGFFDGSTMSAVYGACEVKAGKSLIRSGNEHKGVDHMEIQAYFMDHRFPNNPFRPYQQGTIMSPWQNFVGIATDPNYFWVYRAGAIACATHSEVLACLKDGLAKPNWMVYEIPHEGISKDAYDPETVHEGLIIPKISKRGLLDLAACVDGTLTAIFSDAFESGTSIRTSIYSITPKIDLQARTLKIEGEKTDGLGHKLPTSGWETDRSTPTAYLVTKQPVFCWPVFDGLIQSLEEVQAAHN